MAVPRSIFIGGFWGAVCVLFGAYAYGHTMTPEEAKKTLPKYLLKAPPKLGGTPTPYTKANGVRL